MISAERLDSRGEMELQVVRYGNKSTVIIDLTSRNLSCITTIL